MAVIAWEFADLKRRGGRGIPDRLSGKDNQATCSFNLRATNNQGAPRLFEKGEADTSEEVVVVMHSLSPSRELPAIVSIVLRESARRHSLGVLNEQRFEEQVRRLEREELQPRGLSLVMRKLRDGTTRFLIKDQSGVREMIECREGCVLQQRDSQPS